MSEYSKIILPLRIIIWNKHNMIRDMINIPEIVINNLNSELYIYNMLNGKTNDDINDVIYDSINDNIKYMQPRATYIQQHAKYAMQKIINEEKLLNINYFNIHKINSYGICVLETLYPQLKITYDVNSDYIYQMLTSKNMNLVDLFLYKKQHDVIIKFLNKRALECLVCICARAYKNTLEYFLKLCKTLKIDFDPYSPKHRKYKNIPLTIHGEKNQRILAERKQMNTVISAIEAVIHHDNIEMLKILENNGIDIYHEGFSNQALFSNSYKCYHYILNGIKERDPNKNDIDKIEVYPGDRYMVEEYDRGALHLALTLNLFSTLYESGE